MNIRVSRRAGLLNTTWKGTPLSIATFAAASAIALASIAGPSAAVGLDAADTSAAWSATAPVALPGKHHSDDCRHTKNAPIWCGYASTVPGQPLTPVVGGYASSPAGESLAPVVGGYASSPVGQPLTPVVGGYASSPAGEALTPVG